MLPCLTRRSCGSQNQSTPIVADLVHDPYMLIKNDTMSYFPSYFVTVVAAVVALGFLASPHVVGAPHADHIGRYVRGVYTTAIRKSSMNGKWLVAESQGSIHETCHTSAPRPGGHT